MRLNKERTRALFELKLKQSIMLTIENTQVPVFSSLESNKVCEKILGFKWPVPASPSRERAIHMVKASISSLRAWR
jgi:hypothetical protein